MFGQLGWINPWWLWGLAAAVGLPVLAHILSRWTGRKLVFPTIRFLQRAADQGRRRLRLRELLLLLLRCLALTAIVLAFARPIWRSSAATPSGSGRHLLILLDRSASMQRAAAGVTLWNQAQHKAQQLLAQLDPQYDLASVILVDAHPAALWSEPSANFSRLAALISEVQPTSERGDVDAALALAFHLAKAGRLRISAGDAAAMPVPTLELISDFQATQRPGAQPAVPPLHRHRVGSAQVNFALQKPELTPVVPVVQQPTAVSVELACFSPDNSGLYRAKVQLRWGKQTWTQAVAVHANSTATVRFTFTPTQAGADQLELSLGESDALAGDALPLDNATGLFFTVAQARQVALVTAARLEDRSTASYFLARAIAPDQGLDEAQSDLAHVQRVVITPAQLPTLLKSGQPPVAVVLVETGDIPDATLRVLHEYIRQGGGVWWIVDSAPAWAALRRWDALTTGGVSPLHGTATSTSGGEGGDARALRPGAKRDSGGGWVTVSSATLAAGDFDDPILSLFDGPARAELLRTTFHIWGQGTLSPQAQALLKFTDGQPALAGRWIERGRLMVLAASLAPDSTDLPKMPVFAPLVQQILRHLTPGPRAAPHPHPGDLFTLTLPAGPAQNWRLLDPRQQSLALNITGNASSGWTLQGPRLTLAGAYPVQVDAQLLGGVQADLDLRESDLRTPAEMAEGAGGSTPATPATQPDGAGTGPVGPLDRATELWPWLMLLGALLLAVEQLILMLTETGMRLRWRMGNEEGGTP